MEISVHLQGLLDTLPTQPGCDSLKNAAGTIYLRWPHLNNRVRSHSRADASNNNQSRLIDNHQNEGIIGQTGIIQPSLIRFRISGPT
jgi:hypothetical protein